MSEDSLYVRIADKVNEASHKALHSPKHFIGTLMIISAVILSTVFISQTACAEGGCSTSYECLICQQEKEQCEKMKNHMSTMAYLSFLAP